MGPHSWNVHLESRTNWLEFGGQGSRSKGKVGVARFGGPLWCTRSTWWVFSSNIHWDTKTGWTWLDFGVRGSVCVYVSVAINLFQPWLKNATRWTMLVNAKVKIRVLNVLAASHILKSTGSTEITLSEHTRVLGQSQSSTAEMSSPLPADFLLHSTVENKDQETYTGKEKPP